MSKDDLVNELNEELNEEFGVTLSRRQKLFIKYTMMVLIDLVVLGLFNEYWDLVFIEYFSVTLLTAALLQLLLQLTLAIEHKVAHYFSKMAGLKAKILRGLSTWAILFISKLIILKAISFAFGTSVVFSGPVHGLVAFIVVVIAIIAAEQLFDKVYRALA